MGLTELLKSSNVLVTEGSMFEKLRRSPEVKLDPSLAHAALIDEPAAAKVLEEAYRSYLDVGHRYDLPILMFSATWRANAKRISESKYSGENLNADNIQFLQTLRSSYGNYAGKVAIGGLMGCAGDAYKASEALDAETAEEFHSFQARALSDAGADFLFGSTLPSSEEALGLGRAMAKTKSPFCLSFVIRSNGQVLDGVHLKDAIDRLDAALTPQPLGYWVNCVHPSVFLKAFEAHKNSEWMKRVIGFQGNTSKKSPEELAQLIELETSSPEELATDTRKLHEVFGLKILGGCCGTDATHLESIAKNLRTTG